MFVVGDIVLNERVDVAVMKDGQERRWHVSGVMRIAGGKIAEWRDYPLPGAEAAP
jgi:limonene-1,2-epoxide hydrolase